MMVGALVCMVAESTHTLFTLIRESATEVVNNQYVERSENARYKEQVHTETNPSKSP